MKRQLGSSVSVFPESFQTTSETIAPSQLPLAICKASGETFKMQSAGFLKAVERDPSNLTAWLGLSQPMRGKGVRGFPNPPPC